MGKRFSYSVLFSSKALKQYAWANDIDYCSWEFRPGNTTSEMLKDISAHMKTLTFFAVKKAAEVAVPFCQEYLGQMLRLLYMKHFKGIEGHFSDIGKYWLTTRFNAVPADSKKYAIAVPPMIFALRGRIDDYGAVPNTHTLAYLYIPETRDGERGLVFKGQYDEGESEFNPDAHFTKANPEVTLD
jgi:hypothetical protein